MVIMVAVDFAKDAGFNTECMYERRDDGSFAIVGFNQWRHDIDLSPDPTQPSPPKPITPK